MSPRRKLSPRLQALRERQIAAVRATIAAVERRRSGFVPPPAPNTIDHKAMAAGESSVLESHAR